MKPTLAMKIPIPSSLRATLLFSALVCSFLAKNDPVSGASLRDLAPSTNAAEIRALQQNWTDDEANWFYNVPQGSKLVPYTWFLHLEQPGSQSLFRDTEHMRTLGYLPRKPVNPANPDGLPIGFTKDGDHLGVTCAACHTTQINFQGRAWLIDGAPTLADVDRLQRRLVESLEQTLTDPAKFDRFAGRVLEAGAAPAMKADLKNELAKAIRIRKGYNERNLPKPGATAFGPGRVDALGAIFNEVTSTFAQAPNNHQPANAPVSYPFLWDTPQHDKVQWNGAAVNTILPLPIAGTRHIGALGRNAGEVLGVFAEVDATSAGFLGLGGYPSSINKENLIEIEEALRKLWSPQWPTELGPINPVDQQNGKQLFSANCANCHDDTFNRTSPDRHVTARMSAVGTDSLMASNFANRHAQTGILKGRLVTIPGFRWFVDEAVTSEMLKHLVQRTVLGPSANNPNDDALAAIAPQYVINAELRLSDKQKLIGSFNILNFDLENGKIRGAQGREDLTLRDGARLLFSDKSSDTPGRFFTNDATLSVVDLARRPKTLIASLPNGRTQLRFDEPVPVSYQYKGRPLNGIWATAPYLHNGSVPNLDELLKPPAKRIKRFKVGSREFDPATVGFRIDQGDFDFDTSLSGNSNGGHDYSREFSEDERRQLIEYLKSL